MRRGHVHGTLLIGINTRRWTLLLNAGVPPHVVRDIAGHSAIDVTMMIYARISLDEKRAALTKLGDRLG